MSTTPSQASLDNLAQLGTDTKPKAAPSADKSAETKNQEHVSNSVWEDIKQVGWNDIAAPAYNATRGSLNTIAHLGFATFGQGSGHEHLLPEADTSGAGEIGKTIQGISSGLVTVVELGLEAKFGSKLLRSGGELVKADSELNAFGKSYEIGNALRKLAADRKAGLFVGATIAELAKDPDKAHGETRIGNATGMITSLAIYELGNKTPGQKSFLSRNAGRAGVGFVAGEAQSFVSGAVSSLINGKPIEGPSLDYKSGLRSMAISVLLPGVLKVPERLATRTNTGVYADEFAKSQHEAAKKALAPGQEAVPGTWAHQATAQAAIESGRFSLKATVKTSTTETSAHVDQAKKSIVVPRAPEPAVEAPKSTVKRAIASVKGVFSDNTHQQVRVSPADFIEENAHIKVAADARYENAFKGLEGDLKNSRTGDQATQTRVEAEVKAKYVETRVDQEIAAREIRNEKMAKLGANPYIAATDRAVISREYQARFAQEANDFVAASREGKSFRPQTDHSFGGIPAHPEAIATPVHPAGDSPIPTPISDPARETNPEKARQRWPKADKYNEPDKDGKEFQLWWRNGAKVSVKGVDYPNVVYAQFDANSNHIWLRTMDPHTRTLATDVDLYDPPKEGYSYASVDGKVVPAKFTYSVMEQNIQTGTISYKVQKGQVGDSPRVLPDNSIYEVHSAVHPSGGGSRWTVLNINGHDVHVNAIVRSPVNPVFENIFQNLENDLKVSKTQDPETRQQTLDKVKGLYIHTRVEQEIADRHARNLESSKFGSSAGTVEAGGDKVHEAYKQRYADEADAFIKATLRNAKFRPSAAVGKVEYGIAGGDGVLTELTKPQVHNGAPLGWEPGDPVPPDAMISGVPNFQLYQQEIPQRDGSVTRYLYDPRAIKRVMLADGSVGYGPNTDLTPEQRAQLVPNKEVDIFADGTPDAAPAVEAKTRAIAKEYPDLENTMATINSLAEEIHQTDDPSEKLQKIYRQMSSAERELGGRDDARAALTPLRRELLRLIGGQEVSFKILDRTQSEHSGTAAPDDDAETAGSKGKDPYREVQHGHFVEVERTADEIRYFDGFTGDIKVVKFGGEKLDIETHYADGKPTTHESVDAIDEEYPDGKDTPYGPAVSARIGAKSVQLTFRDGGTMEDWNRKAYPDGFPTPFGKIRRRQTIPALPSEAGAKMFDQILYREDVNKGQPPYTQVTIKSRPFAVPGLPNDFGAYAVEEFPGISGSKRYHLGHYEGGQLITEGVLDTRSTPIATSTDRLDIPLGSSEYIWRTPDALSIIKSDGQTNSGWSKKVISFDADSPNPTPSVIIGPIVPSTTPGQLVVNPLDLYTDPNRDDPDLYRAVDLGPTDVFAHDANGQMQYDGMNPIARPIYHEDYIVKTQQAKSRASLNNPLETNGLMTPYGLALGRDYYYDGSSKLYMQNQNRPEIIVDRFGRGYAPDASGNYLPID